jgi:histidinol dehydrogenase
MTVQIVAWDPNRPSAVVSRFLERPAFDARAEDTARCVLSDIQTDGNKAVARYAKEFDGVSLRPSDFRVSREDIAKARETVDPEVRATVRDAHRRIAAFAAAGLKRDWSMPTPRGGTVGEQFVPYDRVGAYVPGGTAPLVSTALMTITLAKAAGVTEIVACTPCGASKQIAPALLFAMELAGASEIYRVGGIQAIGMMAFGTRTVKKVQKIVGPGNAYVTAAKRQVYGHVSLDLVAGPSEIAILADPTAKPRFVAADLLSQAEHGSGHEKALLVTTSKTLAGEVAREIESQSMTLSRQDAVQGVMKRGGILIVLVNTLDAGMDLCNRFAPEHFEIMVREARSWLKKVKCAGAVFVGDWTPEAAGDFVAGPSHVLPTGGAAAMFSGLTVDDFRRRSSYMAFTRADLQDTVAHIETFGRIEGLDAHARSANIRFEKP